MTTISVIVPFSSSFLDYPDTESVAVVIYLCGCEHHCPKCHNPELQNRNNGTNMAASEFEDSAFAELYKHKTNKLVLSGGDPLMSKNESVVRDFLLKNQHRIDVCIYTGYDICHVRHQNINGYKFIKCGKYDEKLKQTPRKTNTEFVLASTNQKLYNQKNRLISTDGIYKFGGIGWKQKIYNLLHP